MTPAFSSERLERIARAEPWHFWFVGRHALVERLLSRHLPAKRQSILDVGCGTGFMVKALAEQGHRVTGLDLRPEGLHALQQKRPRTALAQADAMRLPLLSQSFDVLLLLDTLEHADDVTLLAQLHRVLRRAGLLVLSVPAMPWLWSSRDEAAGHLRRYTQRELRRVLLEAGFRVLETRYYQALLFPLLVVTRWLGRNRPQMNDVEERPSPLLNYLLTRINVAEVRLSDYVSWPWGSSLVAACRKV